MKEALSYLWPRFELLRAPGFHPEELGVWIWIIMAMVFAISLHCLVWHGVRFSRRRRAVATLLQQLQEGQGLHVALETEERDGAAMREVRELWQAYADSLVSSADGSQRYSTLAAEHFFNGHSLARGLTSSRLLAAAPTFLTALGVLGTFIGLTLGLRELQVDAAEIDTIKHGVSHMINGAAVAFMTSVWGVLLSLVLNLVEKVVERQALFSITGLQLRIDRQYPHLPAERSLIQIADATDESKDALQHLHERIGDHLQKAVAGMSESMQQALSQALNEVLAPAVQTLVRNASQQSTEMLEELISRFTEGLSSAGAEQGRFMQQAAEELHNSATGISERLETLFEGLDSQLTGAREHTEHTAREFSRLLAEQRDESAQQQREIVQQFGSLAERFSSQAEAQLERSTEEDRQRAQVLSEARQQLMEDLTRQQRHFQDGTMEQIQALSQAGQSQQEQLAKVFSGALSQLQGLIEGQVRAVSERERQQGEHFHSLAEGLADGARQAQQQMEEMAQQHRQLLDELGRVVDSVQASSRHMDSSSTQLGLLSSNLREATEALSGGMVEISQSLEQTSARSSGLVEQVAGQVALVEQLQQALMATTENLGQAARQAEQGFQQMSRHQQEFLTEVRREFEELGQALADQVEGVEKQAEAWLQAYSREVQDQVNHRMQEWNGATLKFADGMKSVVGIIENMVEEMEAKV